MQTQNRFFDDMARVAAGAMGALSGVRGEIEARFRDQLERILAGMDLVSREEFEAVKAMAATAREEQVVVEISGRWCDYRMYFLWQEELSALHFSCGFDMKVPKRRRGVLYELLALANERLWLGHFDLAAGDASPSFRYAVLLRGIGMASAEQVEDLVDIALSECERFYPAFQLVIWGGKPAEEAMTTAMIEPIGEA